MTSRPTYDDANLILRLYDMRREERMRKARAWFTANFKPKSWDDLQKMAPGGSDENASYRMVVTYWDMVGSFITAGVLNKELFFESGREMLLVWERMRDILPLVPRPVQGSAALGPPRKGRQRVRRRVPQPQP